MITGTVRNAVKLQAMTNKWEQKKQSGNVLSKDERNERASWTPEQRMKNDYEEQLKQDKENGKRNEIANKISSGQKLTPEEEKYLASYDPQGLADYKQTQNERKAYEEKLKSCKTKDEVQKLKTTTLGNELAALKKTINDPYIPLSEKLKKAQQALGKTKNFQEEEEEFIESGQYAKLPTEAELEKEREDETRLQNEYENELLQESADENELNNAEAVSEQKELVELVDQEEQKVLNLKSQSVNDAAGEIEKLYNHIALAQQLEDGADRNLESEAEKKLGKNVNLSV